MSHKPQAKKAAFKRADHYDPDPKPVDEPLEQVARELREQEEKEKQE